jgi:hypothetical protein
MNVTVTLNPKAKPYMNQMVLPAAVPDPQGCTLDRITLRRSLEHPGM